LSSRGKENRRRSRKKEKNRYQWKIGKEKKRRIVVDWVVFVLLMKKGVMVAPFGVSFAHCVVVGS
jgi:hypothetical protein